MAPSLESLGIDKLSVEDRLELIDMIRDSLPGTAQPSGIPEWHIQLLKERLAADDADPEAGVLWSDFRAEWLGEP